MRRVDVVVIGGGQSGLACGYYLRRAGLDHVILDRQVAPGGAWQSTWPSLSLFSSSAHSSLPGWPMLSHPDVFPPVEHALAYLREYEGRYDLPVERPVAVEDVRSDPGRIDVVTDAGVVRARYVINATGTWSAPFVPGVEGARTFRGRQLHSAHYRGPGEFVGQRVAVVGGGNSGVQITADLVGVAREARAKGALQVRAMFDRMTPDGAVIGRDHLDVDTVIWCTGFRPALRHLRSLGLRTSQGIPEVEDHRAVRDPRVSFVGYGDWTGPASATLIGVGRTAKRLVAGIAAEIDST